MIAGMRRCITCLLALLGALSSGCDIGSLDSDDDSAAAMKPDPKLSKLGNEVAGDWVGTIADVAFRLDFTPEPDAARGAFDLKCVATGCEKTLPGVNSALIAAVFPHTGSYRLNSIAADGRALCSLNPLDAVLLDGGDLSSVQPGATLAQFGLSAEGTRLEFSMSLPFGSTESWPASFLRLSAASAPSDGQAL
jgi:hypothetical protein